MKEVKIHRVWVRPGIIFWKTNDSGYIEDLIKLGRRKINSSAYQILQACSGDEVKQIVTKIKENFPPTPGIEEDVVNFIKELKNNNYVIENSPHKILKSYPLGLVFIELTYRCNLRCITCYNSASPEYQNDELSASEWKVAIKKIEEVAKPTIIFTGGEPLVRTDFFEIASYFKKKGFPVQLFTNGGLIDKAVASKLASVGIDYVRISVDGASEEIHDKIRGNGSFKKTLKGIEYLSKEGIKICLQSVICKINFHQLSELLKLALTFHLDGFRCASLDPIGRGERIKNLCLSSAEELHLWLFLTEASMVYGNKIKVGWGADYCMDDIWNQFITGSQNVGTKKSNTTHTDFSEFVKNSICGVGIRSCLLTPGGYIALCPLLASPEFHMGHILKDNFRMIWERGLFFQILRTTPLERFDKCGACGFRYACLGGCRGSAYRLNSSITGCDSKLYNTYEYFAKLK